MPYEGRNRRWCVRIQLKFLRVRGSLDDAPAQVCSTVGALWEVWCFKCERVASELTQMLTGSSTRGGAAEFLARRIALKRASVAKVKQLAIDDGRYGIRCRCVLDHKLVVTGYYVSCHSD